MTDGSAWVMRTENSGATPRNGTPVKEFCRQVKDTLARGTCQVCGKSISVCPMRCSPCCLSDVVYCPDHKRLANTLKCICLSCGLPKVVSMALEKESDSNGTHGTLCRMLQDLFTEKHMNMDLKTWFTVACAKCQGNMEPAVIIGFAQRILSELGKDLSGDLCLVREMMQGSGLANTNDGSYSIQACAYREANELFCGLEIKSEDRIYNKRGAISCRDLSTQLERLNLRHRQTPNILLTRFHFNEAFEPPSILLTRIFNEHARISSSRSENCLESNVKINSLEKLSGAIDEVARSEDLDDLKKERVVSAMQNVFWSTLGGKRGHGLEYNRGSYVGTRATLANISPITSYSLQSTSSANSIVRSEESLAGLLAPIWYNPRVHDRMLERGELEPETFSIHVSRGDSYKFVYDAFTQFRWTLQSVPKISRVTLRCRITRALLKAHGDYMVAEWRAPVIRNAVMTWKLEIDSFSKVGMSSGHYPSQCKIPNADFDGDETFVVISEHSRLDSIRSNPHANYFDNTGAGGINVLTLHQVHGYGWTVWNSLLPKETEAFAPFVSDVIGQSINDSSWSEILTAALFQPPAFWSDYCFQPTGSAVPFVDKGSVITPIPVRFVDACDPDNLFRDMLHYVALKSIKNTDEARASLVTEAFNRVHFLCYHAASIRPVAFTTTLFVHTQFFDAESIRDYCKGLLANAWNEHALVEKGDTVWIGDVSCSLPRDLRVRMRKSNNHWVKQIASFLDARARNAQNPFDSVTALGPFEYRFFPSACPGEGDDIDNYLHGDTCTEVILPGDKDLRFSRSELSPARSGGLISLFARNVLLHGTERLRAFEEGRSAVPHSFYTACSANIMKDPTSILCPLLEYSFLRTVQEEAIDKLNAQIYSSVTGKTLTIPRDGQQAKLDAYAHGSGLCDAGFIVNAPSRTGEKGMQTGPKIDHWAFAKRQFAVWEWIMKMPRGPELFRACSLHPESHLTADEWITFPATECLARSNGVSGISFFTPVDPDRVIRFASTKESFPGEDAVVAQIGACSALSVCEQAILAECAAREKLWSHSLIAWVLQCKKLSVSFADGTNVPLLVSKEILSRSQQKSINLIKKGEGGVSSGSSRVVSMDKAIQDCVNDRQTDPKCAVTASKPKNFNQSPHDLTFLLKDRKPDIVSYLGEKTTGFVYFEDPVIARFRLDPNQLASCRIGRFLVRQAWFVNKKKGQHLSLCLGKVTPNRNPQSYECNMCILGLTENEEENDVPYQIESFLNQQALVKSIWSFSGNSGTHKHNSVERILNDIEESSVQPLPVFRFRLQERVETKQVRTNVFAHVFHYSREGWSKLLRWCNRRDVCLWVNMHDLMKPADGGFTWCSQSTSLLRILCDDEETRRRITIQIRDHLENLTLEGGVFRTSAEDLEDKGVTLCGPWSLPQGPFKFHVEVSGGAQEKTKLAWKKLARIPQDARKAFELPALWFRDRGSLLASSLDDDDNSVVKVHVSTEEDPKGQVFACMYAELAQKNGKSSYLGARVHILTTQEPSVCAHHARHVFTPAACRAIQDASDERLLDTLVDLARKSQLPIAHDLRVREVCLTSEHSVVKAASPHTVESLLPIDFLRSHLKRSNDLSALRKIGGIPLALRSITKAKGGALFLENFDVKAMLAVYLNRMSDSARNHKILDKAALEVPRELSHDAVSQLLPDPNDRGKLNLTASMIQSALAGFSKPPPEYSMVARGVDTPELIEQLSPHESFLICKDLIERLCKLDVSGEDTVCPDDVLDHAKLSFAKGNLVRVLRADGQAHVCKFSHSLLSI